MTRYTLAMILVLACTGHLAAAAGNQKPNWRRALITSDAAANSLDRLAGRRLTAAAGDVDASDAKEGAQVVRSQGELGQEATNDKAQEAVDDPAPALAPSPHRTLSSILAPFVNAVKEPLARRLKELFGTTDLPAPAPTPAPHRDQ